MIINPDTKPTKHSVFIENISHWYIRSAVPVINYKRNQSTSHVWCPVNVIINYKVRRIYGANTLKLFRSPFTIFFRGRVEGKSSRKFFKNTVAEILTRLVCIEFPRLGTYVKHCSVYSYCVVYLSTITCSFSISVRAFNFLKSKVYIRYNSIISRVPSTHVIFVEYHECSAQLCHISVQTTRVTSPGETNLTWLIR